MFLFFRRRSSGFSASESSAIEEQQLLWTVRKDPRRWMAVSPMFVMSTLSTVICLCQVLKVKPLESTNLGDITREKVLDTSRGVEWDFSSTRVSLFVVTLLVSLFTWFNICSLILFQTKGEIKKVLGDEEKKKAAAEAAQGSILVQSSSPFLSPIFLSERSTWRGKLNHFFKEIEIDGENFWSFFAFMQTFEVVVQALRLIELAGFNVLRLKVVISAEPAYILVQSTVLMVEVLAPVITYSYNMRLASLIFHAAVDLLYCFAPVLATSDFFSSASWVHSLAISSSFELVAQSIPMLMGISELKSLNALLARKLLIKIVKTHKRNKEEMDQVRRALAEQGKNEEEVDVFEEAPPRVLPAKEAELSPAPFPPEDPISKRSTMLMKKQSTLKAFDADDDFGFQGDHISIDSGVALAEETQLEALERRAPMHADSDLPEESLLEAKTRTGHFRFESGAISPTLGLEFLMEENVLCQTELPPGMEEPRTLVKPCQVDLETSEEKHVKRDEEDEKAAAGSEHRPDVVDLQQPEETRKLEISEPKAESPIVTSLRKSRTRELVTKVRSVGKVVAEVSRKRASQVKVLRRGNALRFGASIMGFGSSRRPRSPNRTAILPNSAGMRRKSSIEALHSDVRLMRRDPTDQQKLGMLLAFLFAVGFLFFVVYQLFSGKCEAVDGWELCEWRLHPIFQLTPCDCRFLYSSESTPMQKTDCPDISQKIQNFPRLEYFYRAVPFCFDSNSTLLALRGLQHLRVLYIMAPQAKQHFLLEDLPSLEQLVFSQGGHFTYFPDVFDTFPELTSLQVLQSSLTDLPPSLLSHPKLDEAVFSLTPFCLNETYMSSLPAHVQCSSLLSLPEEAATHCSTPEMDTLGTACAVLRTQGPSSWWNTECTQSCERALQVALAFDSNQDGSLTYAEVSTLLSVIGIQAFPGPEYSECVHLGLCPGLLDHYGVEFREHEFSAAYVGVGNSVGATTCRDCPLAQAIRTKDPVDQ